MPLPDAVPVILATPELARNAIIMAPHGRDVIDVSYCCAADDVVILYCHEVLTFEAAEPPVVEWLGSAVPADQEPAVVSVSGEMLDVAELTYVQPINNTDADGGVIGPALGLALLPVADPNVTSSVADTPENSAADAPHAFGVFAPAAIVIVSPASKPVVNTHNAIIIPSLSVL